MDIYVKLARQTIKEYLQNKRFIDSQEIPPKLTKIRAGCFVSLHQKKDHTLRGCLGTILPTCKNLGHEIINNAIAACQDPRFTAVTVGEFDNLDIQVDVLSEPEPIESEKSLDPKKYGVIVKTTDNRTGLLLPDLEGINDSHYQIAVARQKAGIKITEPIYLYRFTVNRHRS